jgi:DNA adenine methylase
MNKNTRPFLKWAGGKRQLLPTLSKFLPKKYVAYLEPFVGAGALLFHLQPKKAIINDMNKDLINCYIVIRDNLDALIEELKKYKNEEEFFYQVRNLDRKDSFHFKTPVEKASRTIYLNKTCYNGLFRVNSQGFFNAPYGRYKNPKYVDFDVLKSIQEYLNSNSITILNCDFETAVKDAKKGDFIYFDPPYHPLSKTSSFTGYGVNGFSEDEQVRLHRVYSELDKRGCFVMLSNSATDFIYNLYHDFNVKTIQANRNINSNATCRGKIDEVLVLNYD